MNKTSFDLLKPFVETAIRFFSSSPKYFKGLRVLILFLMAVIGGLTIVHDNNLFTLPDWLLRFTGIDSLIVAGLFWILGKLPSDDTTEVKEKVDQVLKK